MLKVYHGFNNHYWALVSELTNMFGQDYPNLTEHKEWVGKQITQHGAETKTVFLEVTPGLETIYQRIHKMDPLIFDEPIALMDKLHLKEIYVRMLPNEQQNLFAKLKLLISQAAVCTSLGTNTSKINEIFQYVREKNPNVQDMNELRSKLTKDILLDPEMREHVFDLILNPNGSGISDTVASLGPLVNALGLTAGAGHTNEETKDEEYNNENDNNEEPNNTDDTTDNTNDKTTETKNETNNQDIPDTTASHSYLSRKKMMGQLRKERQKLKKQQPNMLASYADMLKNFQQDHPLDPTEFKETINSMMENPATRAMYERCVSQVKSPSDIPSMMQAMCQESGVENNEMMEMCKKMQGKNPMEMQAMIADEARRRGHDVPDLQSMMGYIHI
jgi:hypothetical protein